MKCLRKMKLGDEILICAMSNLRPKTTNLPMVIWILSKTGKEKHGPRIKAQNHYGDKIESGSWFSLTIDDSPKVTGDTKDISSKDITKIKKFIIQNKDILLQHWNLDIDTNELFKKLKKFKD